MSCLELGHIEGVAEMEAFNSTTIDWRLSPDDEWRQGTSDRPHRLSQPENEQVSSWSKAIGRSDRSCANGQDYATYGLPASGRRLPAHRRAREARSTLAAGVIYDQLAAAGHLRRHCPVLRRTRNSTNTWSGNKDYGQVLVNADYWDEDHVTELADRIDDRWSRWTKTPGASSPIRTSTSSRIRWTASSS